MGAGSWKKGHSESSCTMNSRRKSQIIFGKIARETGSQNHVCNAIVGRRYGFAGEFRRCTLQFRHTISNDIHVDMYKRNLGALHVRPVSEIGTLVGGIEEKTSKGGSRDLEKRLR